jgi:Tol biopolymer transport system component
MSTDDSSTRERIRQALDLRLKGVGPPPPYDRRLGRRAAWRWLATATLAVLATFAVIGLVMALLPLGGGGGTNIPRSSDVQPGALEGTLVFSRDGMQMEAVHLPDESVSDVPGGDVSTIDLDISPDGERVAYALSIGPYEGELWVLDLTSGDATRIVHGEGTIISPSWTGDGREIAFISESIKDSPATPVFRIGFVGSAGEGLRYVDEPALGAVNLSVSPDGSAIAYVSNAEADVEMVDVDSGQTSTLWPHESGTASDVAWSPDGKKVAIIEKGAIKLVSILAGHEVEDVSTNLAGVFGLTWSRDSSALVVSAEANRGDGADLFGIDLTSGSVSDLPSTKGDDISPSLGAPKATGVA